MLRQKTDVEHVGVGEKYSGVLPRDTTRIGRRVSVIRRYLDAIAGKKTETSELILG